MLSRLISNSVAKSQLMYVLALKLLQKHRLPWQHQKFVKINVIWLKHLRNSPSNMLWTIVDRAILCFKGIYGLKYSLVLLNSLGPNFYRLLITKWYFFGGWGRGHKVKSWWTRWNLSPCSSLSLKFSWKRSKGLCEYCTLMLMIKGSEIV